MKYARLSLNDLKDLEKEFIEFLVLNGIPADDWEKMKTNDMEKAEKIIDQFSDVVWESILRKTEMLEFRRKDFLTICRIRKNELLTFVVKSEDKSLDFSKDEVIESVLKNIEEHQLTLRKDIATKPAPELLFDFIKTGFYITKNELYKELFEKRA